MERERGSILNAAIHDVARSRKANAYHTHDHARVVRVYLWAVLHDRPVDWACKRRHWDRHICPRPLPSQSTMSRRLRTNVINDFLHALGKRLAAAFAPALMMLKIIDGKPLTVSSHSKDAQATRGPAGPGVARGDKLHAVWDERALPTCWQVRPLGDNEKTVAAQMIPQLSGAGYVLGDGFYHANRLFSIAHDHDHQLLSPRAHPGTTVRQPRRFHPARLRCIEMLESSDHCSAFGKELFDRRREIETRFAHLTSFGGGLTHLPPWVRGLHRVTQWVHGKLLINAARIRRIRA